jgi:predicted enzyme related to lactoylglutathione lyase
MERSMTFYTSLGFVQDQAGVVDEKGTQWYSLMMGEARVWVLRADTVEGFQGSTPRGYGVHLYLTVDDVDGLYDKLKASGATIVREIETQYYGLREFIVADPDGYTWTINMPVNARAQEALDGQEAK